MASKGTVALIGFGEAGMAFAGAWRVTARAYDIKTDDPALAAAKRADYARTGIVGTDTLADALDGATLIMSLVTADQALIAAQAAAKSIAPGALYCDFNSVAPQTKQEAARLIEAAGAAYADVAVMAPVHPAGLAVPMLVSGADAGAALAGLGFSLRRIEGPVGRASTIKMLRSVMVKGIEALTAECFLAARKAGVADEVAASLDASGPDSGWAARAEYNLSRMRAHGLRRAAEMEEAAKTLYGLGQSSDMARAAAKVQRRIGAAHQASEAA